MFRNKQQIWEGFIQEVIGLPRVEVRGKMPVIEMCVDSYSGRGLLWKLHAVGVGVTPQLLMYYSTGDGDMGV
jgi:hypothetical protein